MTDYRDGKIHGWNGGKCPVHPNDEIEWWTRKDSSADMTGTAGIRSWGHFGLGADIIAFRVTKKYREPREVWVNEYRDGLGDRTFKTREAAAAMLGVKPILFREVLE